MCVVAASPAVGWFVTLYPAAAEAGGTFRGSLPERRAYVPRGQAADPDRSSTEAGRRARRRLRRYCAANGLNRLGTLTYGPPFCHDPRQARADVGVFFRALRAELGGAPLPYVWVPEWHKTGERLHLHFAVGRYIPRRTIEAAWGHGFVHIKLLGDLPAGSGRVAEARVAAGYLSKYVAKSFDDDARRPAGLHRFDVAQGFTPARVRFWGRTADEAIGRACEQMGSTPVVRWSSDEAEDWAGAPAVWMQWAA